MKLNTKALALSAAILWGGYVFLVALLAWLGVNLPWFNGQIVTELAKVYFGYAATFVGALLGLIYGFVCGYVSGWLFGWLYNKLAK